jgi:hypothetical protein
MGKKKRVLVIGLEPTLVDFSLIPDLNAEKVMAALKADQAKLNALGYDTQLFNVVHQNAPKAKLCFNTKPSDTAEAIQRWV